MGLLIKFAVMLFDGAGSRAVKLCAGKMKTQPIKAFFYTANKGFVGVLLQTSFTEALCEWHNAVANTAETISADRP